MQEIPGFNSWVRRISWKRDRLPTPTFLGFPCDSAGKESTCNVGDLGLITGWEDPLEKGTAALSSILAREVHGLYGPWGHKQWHRTERLQLELSLSLLHCRQILYHPSHWEARPPEEIATVILIIL